MTSDLLYTPLACPHDPNERARKLAEFHEMHLRWLARQAPIQARDRRWRRIGQAVLAVLALAVLGALGWAYWTVTHWAGDDSVVRIVNIITGVNLGGLTTTITLIRMVYAWRKRRRGTAAQRAADAASSMLPGR